MAVAIAAQACLPVLRLGLRLVRRLHRHRRAPDVVVARREVIDDDGVVHDYDEELVRRGDGRRPGDAVVARRGRRRRVGRAWGYNVVIHEFAHVLDMRDGAGRRRAAPARPRRARALAAGAGAASTQAFCARVDAGEDTLLDPYGAEAIDEFFAVASEVFFVDAPALRAEHPELYELLAGYYRQDPAAPTA